MGAYRTRGLKRSEPVYCGHGAAHGIADPLRLPAFQQRAQGFLHTAPRHMVEVALDAFVVIVTTWPTD